GQRKAIPTLLPHADLDRRAASEIALRFQCRSRRRRNLRFVLRWDGVLAAQTALREANFRKQLGLRCVCRLYAAECDWTRQCAFAFEVNILEPISSSWNHFVSPRVRIPSRERHPRTSDQR